jgi:hypothetical protein
MCIARRTYFDTFWASRSLWSFPRRLWRAIMPACLVGHAGDDVFLTPFGTVFSATRERKE